MDENPNAFSPMTGRLSLDDLAAEVRSACLEESAARDRLCVLMDLQREATTRLHIITEARAASERRLRDAYNEACRP